MVRGGRGSECALFGQLSIEDRALPFLSFQSSFPAMGIKGKSLHCFQSIKANLIVHSIDYSKQRVISSRKKSIDGFA